MKKLKKKIINWLLSWASFWVALFWVVYAANIITVTTQTISTWASIWAGWYQSVNDKLLDVYSKSETDTKDSLKADKTNTYTKAEVDALVNEIVTVWTQLQPWLSCKDILDNWWSKGDWNYFIKPSWSTTTLELYCDMTTDGWGWTSISRVPSSGVKSSYCVSSRVWWTNTIYYKDNNYWKLSDSEINSVVNTSSYEILVFENDWNVREKFWTNNTWNTTWAPWVEKSWKNWAWSDSSDATVDTANCGFQWWRSHQVTYYTWPDMSWNWTTPNSDVRWIYKTWDKPLCRMATWWSDGCIMTTLVR